MHCPQCGAAAPDAARPLAGCAHCGGYLDPAAIDPAATAVPLSDAQRMLLRANALAPTCFLALTLAVLGGMSACIFGRFAGTTFFIVGGSIAGLIVAGVVAATALHVRASYLDLRRGMAEVAVARLVRLSTQGSSPRSFHGEFEGVGTLTIALATVYGQLAEGRRYRIFYSRRSRRLWTIVPAE